MAPIVIIGSGLAGYGLLRELRKRGAQQPVTVITADDGRAYAKPNLSNALAAGKSADQLASQDAAQLAATHSARILTDTRVLAIDPAARQVITDQGPIDYAHLVLALGADPLPHGLTGNAADAVLSVNDLADYARFRVALEGKQHVAILGGGLIGCEFANDLLLQGYRVSVIHAGPAPLDRLLPAGMAVSLQTSLAGQGVDWHCGRRAIAVDRTAQGVRLRLDDGTDVDVDLVLSAIGLRPRTALADGAGLAIRRGIVVDAYLHSSDAVIHAIGDCAEVEGQVLPFVMPLMQQVKALAASLTGEPTPVRYPPMPVVVKTSLHPLTVLPPAPGLAGAWRIEQHAAGERGLFEAADGVRGFALSGSQTGERGRLLQSLLSAG